ncbi:Histone methylation protein [Phytophthora palmivora]|uniref:Histone methylation protein n=1 Tax=Phytophthora palmivora TaxID=4796 RepID=A0A2P4YAZ4_9STRA|nr:Histone methylation protein [Phytophthora palmivora]
MPQRNPRTATWEEALITSRPNLLTLPEVTCAMMSIFGDISAKDVRQHAGQMHNNAGKLLPSGISAMLEALGTLSDRDVFLTLVLELAIDTYPLLRKVFLKAADVRDLVLSSSPLSKLVVARELSGMPNARVIAATSLFCPRHSVRCSQRFCERRKLDQTVMVACSWKSELTPLYVNKDS